MERHAPQKNNDAPHKSYPYKVTVRFANTDKAYTFGTEMSNLADGDMVVVETNQGLEMGQCEGPSMPTSPEMKQDYKPILRLADEEDKQDYEDNIEDAKDAFNLCKDEIERLHLAMHLKSAEYTLDRSRCLFIYMADQRVDFRELLRSLGGKLHCRIELRQIGERDKAKMVGGIGMCGMECCCSRFKTNFDVISINMAKNQLLALNTEKLSGMCGKLMCCLKYEDSTYKELTKGLPKMGAQMEYEGQIYRVTGMNVMSNSVKLENRQSVQFITIDELKEKGISRTGYQAPKKPGGNDPSGRRQRVTVTHSAAATAASEAQHPQKTLTSTATAIAASPVVPSTPVEQTPNPNAEKRSFKGNHNNNNNNNHKKHGKNPHHPNGGNKGIVPQKNPSPNPAVESRSFHPFHSGNNQDE